MRRKVSFSASLPGVAILMPCVGRGLLLSSVPWPLCSLRVSSGVDVVKQALPDMPTASLGTCWMPPHTAAPTIKPAQGSIAARSLDKAVFMKSGFIG